ncbi:phage shock protein A [Variovorax boronicumulans]|uniref:PspA/IM30 family protein n=1 Tax=Variovorax boronicumulans TaxID=436515 RepID=UPI00278507B8|nr:hypothetical protein [Variovorax boronicumulans]MDQ0086098.1 phage shock protein A [Variovorax boronicumulans]
MNTALTKPPAPTRDVDVRGFVYALEPVRQRQQWRMDKLMTSLARVQQALVETEARMNEVQAMHDERARNAGQALVQRMDPGAHRAALGFLTHLRDQRRELDAQRKEKLAERDRLRKDCMALQLRLDGMTQHKEDALTQYADEVRQRNSNEQDRDWLARLAAVRGRVVESSQ